jgi:hypothetical protein
LQTNNDILAQRDQFQWMDCQNIIVSNPTGYLSGVATKRSATTPPPTYYMSLANSYSSFNYSAPIYQKTIATFENTDWPSETWTFSGTGTASLVAAISEGDQCLSLANTAGQTATGTCDPLPTAIGLSSPTYGILAVDTNWSNVSNFSSGYIRIGSDASNYRQYNLSSPGSTGEHIIKFTLASPSSTTGTPNMGAVDYVQISLTAGGGGAITVKFDNLRVASFASATLGTTTLVENAGNVFSSTIYEGTVASGCTFVFNIGDSIFRSSGVSDSHSLVYVLLKSGFTNNYSSSNFYFSQFQNISTQSQNILYYVNGSDGFFSFDVNASAGSANTRISSTNYKYIASHKNMIFLAGSTAAPNTVQPSDVNDPTTLTSANAVVVQNVSGSYVTGLISMDEYIAILRNDGIWKLYGSNPDSATTDFQLIRSESKVGVVEQRSACRVGQYIYFFDGNEIYRFNGETSESISGNLDSVLTGYNRKLCSIYYNQLRDIVVFNFVPSSVDDPVVTKTTYFQLTYCPSLNAWGKLGAYDNTEAVKFWGLSWGGSQISKPLVFNGGLQFYQVDPSTPTDISMPWYIKPQWNDTARPDIDKDFDELQIYVRDQASLNTPACKIEMYSDFDPDTVRQTFQTQNEIQTISAASTPVTGNWTITYDGQTTANIAYNANAAAITSALEALSNIGSGDVGVSGGPLGTDIVVTFQGALAGTNVALMTADVGTTGLSAINVNQTQAGVTYYPANNRIYLLLNQVSGASMTFKLSGTCTDQKDAAVMVSGYTTSYTEIEDT